MTQGILYLIVFVVLLIVAGLYLGRKLLRRNQKPRAGKAGPTKSGMVSGYHGFEKGPGKETKRRP